MKCAPTAAGSLAPCTRPGHHMMTSSNGNIFRVTVPLCGEFTGHWWIPRTKTSDAELWCFIWSAPWINGWVNTREAGDLGRNRAHYDIIAMRPSIWWTHFWTEPFRETVSRHSAHRHCRTSACLVNVLGRISRNISSLNIWIPLYIIRQHTW